MGTIADEIEMARRGEGRLVMVAVHDAQVVAYGRARLWSNAETDGFRNCPTGWWLSGSLVLPEFRRCGLGAALMRRRLSDLSTEVHSRVDVANRVSRALHTNCGFTEITRDFTAPRMRAAGEPMVLLRWPAKPTR